MDNKIKKTITDILTEAKASGHAGITPDDLTNIRMLVTDGIETPRLNEIATSSAIRKQIYSEKIADIDFDQETIAKLEAYMAPPKADVSFVKQVGTNTDPAAKMMKIFFRPESIDGVVLLQNNAMAVYRKGVQFPSVITCGSKEDALSAYNELIEKL